jgi:hypothetical protein
LQNIGLIRDAAWGDLNGDNIGELVVVGDWMTPKVFLLKTEYSQKKRRIYRTIAGFGEVSI